MVLPPCKSLMMVDSEVLGKSELQFALEFVLLIRASTMPDAELDELLLPVVLLEPDVPVEPPLAPLVPARAIRVPMPVVPALSDCVNDLLAVTDPDRA